MEIKMLDKKYHTDAETGFRCRYIKSDTEYFRPHYHNYYELFLMIRGNAKHIVNGEIQKIHERQLFFIRDFDVHDYARSEDSFEFINFAFEKELFDLLFEYIGDSAEKEKFLTSPLPPCTLLSPKDNENLFFSFTELNQSNESQEVITKAKLILAKVFLQYFHTSDVQLNKIPLWLEMTYEKMKNPKNFIAGIGRMCEISGKSREHMSRLFKKYYSQTPTDFITQMRLEMAVNLLLMSNFSVTDICYECGFETLSWFYKCFCKKFGKTPVQYRKDNMLTNTSPDLPHS